MGIYFRFESLKVLCSNCWHYLFDFNFAYNFKGMLNIYTGLQLFTC